MSQVRRSWVTLAAAAAVVILITAVGALAVTWGNDDDSPPAAAPTSEPAATEPTGQPMRQVGQDVVNATVAMTSVAWGTKLDLTCSYDPAEHEYEPPPIWTYALVVRTKDGGVEQVGTWKAIPGQDAVADRRHRQRPGRTSPRSRCSPPTAPPSSASPPEARASTRGWDLSSGYGEVPSVRPLSKGRQVDLGRSPLGPTPAVSRAAGDRRLPGEGLRLRRPLARGRDLSVG